MPEAATVFIPERDQKRSARARALARVGKMVDVPLKTAVDVVRLTQKGIEPQAVDQLIEQGFSKAEVSWIVPARTLTHRRQKNERLTSEESGRWLRAARLQALAREVLGDDEKALRWLHKPRKAFDQLSAMELMKTEAGAQLVEEALGQLDAGYFA